jgi:hypothetical protein
MTPSVPYSSPFRSAKMYSFGFIDAIPWGYMDMQAAQTVSGSEMAQGTFEQWTEQLVVLQVKSGDLRVSLQGIILGETQHTIRFRVDDSWDIDIYKHMILAVEEESWMDSIT